VNAIADDKADDFRRRRKGRNEWSGSFPIELGTPHLLRAKWRIAHVRLSNGARPASALRERHVIVARLELSDGFFAALASLGLPFLFKCRNFGARHAHEFFA
jgi:hypothetical protein